MFDTLSKAGKYLGQAAKMMIGVPDYDNYVEHMRINHPDQTPMTYEAFFATVRMPAMAARAGPSAVDCFRHLNVLIAKSARHVIVI